MALQLFAKAGPRRNLDGAEDELMLDNDTALLVSELHGRYFQQALRENMFGAVAGGVTSSVGLNTTYTGLVISNPLGSPVNLAMNKISFAQSVINAAVNIIGFGTGYWAAADVTHTTPVVPKSTILGSGASPIAKADSAATLPAAPTYSGFLGSTPTAITNPNGGMWDLEGSVIVPPGGFFLFLASAASPASALWLAAQWEEVRI